MKKKQEIIPIIQGKEEKKISRKQKMFNSRVKKIERLKKQILEAQKAMDEAKSSVAKELFPLEDKYNQIQLKAVQALDKAYDLKFFRRKEKEKINDLLLGTSSKLINSMQSEELIEIHNRHVDIANQDVEEEDMEWEEEQTEALSKEMLKSFAKEMLGVDLDLDDVDMSNPEAEFDKIREQIERQQFEQEEEKAKKQQNKKKTKAQEKREEKRKAEEKIVSQTSRKIYTQLAKMLHPDYAKNEEERAWKTEAMKEVTEAYQKDDFFTLLRLQLQYFEKAEGDLNELNDDQLKYYNKILLEQSRELEQEYYNLTAWGPQGQFYRQYCGKNAARIIASEKKEYEGAIKDMEVDIKLYSDKKSFRQYLKQYVIDMFSFDLDFDFFR